jgi:hypothetical protein
MNATFDTISILSRARYLCAMIEVCSCLFRFFCIDAASFTNKCTWLPGLLFALSDSTALDRMQGVTEVDLAERT